MYARVMCQAIAIIFKIDALGIFSVQLSSGIHLHHPRGPLRNQLRTRILPHPSTTQQRGSAIDPTRSSPLRGHQAVGAGSLPIRSIRGYSFS